LFVFVLFCVPCAAQTPEDAGPALLPGEAPPSDTPAPREAGNFAAEGAVSFRYDVAMPPLVNEYAPDATTVLISAVEREIDNLGNYSSHPVNPDVYPEITTLAPDLPPATRFADGARYFLTSEYYLDTEDRYHLQLWLWQADNGRIIYTDELVCDDEYEALEYIPPMVQWIFGQIPPDTVVSQTIVMGTTSPAETPDVNVDVDVNIYNEPEAAEEKHPGFWMSLGVRGGGSLRFYVIPNASGGYQDNRSTGITYEAGFHLGFHLLPSLVIQAEAVVSGDRAVFRRGELPLDASNQEPVNYVYYRDTYTGMTVAPGGFLKYRMSLEPFMTAFYAGVYFPITMGEMSFTDGKAGETSSHEFKIDPSMGLGLGATVGTRLGVGLLFLDLRLGMDLGTTRVTKDRGVDYTRTLFSFSIGYEFELFTRKRRDS
jgi:hypothetical protein